MTARTRYITPVPQTRKPARATSVRPVDREIGAVPQTAPVALQPPTRPRHLQLSRHITATDPFMGNTSEEDDDDVVSVSDGADSEDDDGTNDGRLAKPEGEAGRPNRGGYTLSSVLGWSTVEYLKVKVSDSVSLSCCYSVLIEIHPIASCKAP
jgi:hypothetical protein